MLIVGNEKVCFLGERIHLLSKWYMKRIRRMFLKENILPLFRKVNLASGRDNTHTNIGETSLKIRDILKIYPTF